MDWKGMDVRIDWTRCARRRWPPVARLEFTPQERRKPRHVLLYWWAGRGERLLPDGPAPIHKGLCHWSRPGWSYACTQNPANPLGVTAIHFDLLDGAGEVIPPGHVQLPPERLIVQDPGLVETVTCWIASRAMDARAGVPLSPEINMAACSMLKGLLVKLTHNTASQRQQGFGGDAAAWNRLTAHIHAHLRDLESVARLGDKAGYTRSHFSRLFKARTGLSPQRYIIQARIALVKEMLRGTSLPISEVALLAGYTGAYLLARQFRKQTGLTPSAYRRQACGGRTQPSDWADGTRPFGAAPDPDRP